MSREGNLLVVLFRFLVMKNMYILSLLRSFLIIWKLLSFISYVPVSCRVLLSEKGDIYFNFLLLKVDENLQYFNSSTISSYKDQILQSLMQTCPKWIVKVCTAIRLELVSVWLELWKVGTRKMGQVLEASLKRCWSVCLESQWYKKKVSEAYLDPVKHWWWILFGKIVNPS